MEHLNRTRKESERFNVMSSRQHAEDNSVGMLTFELALPQREREREKLGNVKEMFGGATSNFT